MSKLSFLLGVSVSAVVQAAGCPELKDWLAYKAELAKATTITERAAYQKREFELRAEAANAVFALYLDARLDAEALTACLAPLKDAENFRQSMQAAFFQGSLQRLARQSSPRYSVFNRLLAEKFQQQIPMWRLTGHFRDDSPTSLEAGYHRATGSLFLDYSRVPPNEWLVIFSHELLHALDPAITASSKRFSSETRSKDFVAWSRVTSDPAQLAEDDRAALEEWLRAGLGRGLWAEYRAWVPTFVLYQEARRTNEQAAVGWMDKILAAQKADETLAEHIFHVLDARSRDPKEGIFQNLLIQNTLKSLRERARPREGEPSLGVFSVFLD